MIVVDDGGNEKNLSELSLLRAKYPDIQWIGSRAQKGQIVSLDSALGRVSTKYVFYSEDSVEYLNGSFIQFCRNIMEQNEKVVQVRLHGKVTRSQAQGQQTWQSAEFALETGLIRMSQYASIRGGFTQLTGNATFSSSAGVLERLIANHFSEKGLLAVVPSTDFARRAPCKGKSWPEFHKNITILESQRAQLSESEQAYCDVVKKALKQETLAKSLMRRTRRKLAILPAADYTDAGQKRIVESLVPLLQDKSLQIGYDLDYSDLRALGLFDSLFSNYSSSFFFTELRDDSFDSKTM